MYDVSQVINHPNNFSKPTRISDWLDAVDFTSESFVALRKLEYISIVGSFK